MKLYIEKMKQFVTFEINMKFTIILHHVQYQHYQ